MLGGVNTRGSLLPTTKSSGFHQILSDTFPYVTAFKEFDINNPACTPDLGNDHIFAGHGGYHQTLGFRVQGYIQS